MKTTATAPDGSCAVHIDTKKIPAYVAENLAQSVFECIRKVYDDPAVREDDQRWKAAR